MSWYDQRINLLAYATTAVSISLVSLISPSLPELADRYGVSVSDVAAIQVAALLPGIVSARWLLGPGSRRGVVRMLSWTLLIYGITGGLLLAVTHFPSVLAIRTVQGFAGGGLLAGAFALLSNSGDRERLISRNAALVCVMMAVQPLIGSALASLGTLMPFAFYLGALPLSLVMARVADSHASRRDAPTAPAAISMHAPSVTKALVLTASVNLLLFGWLLYLAPVLLQSAYGMSVTTRGLILSSQALLAAVLAVAVARPIRLGHERSLLYGGLTAPLLGLVTVFVAPTAAVAVVGFVLVGTVYGTANPAILSLVTSQGRRATGAWQSSARIGQVLGPALTAWLLALAGVDATLLAGIALAAVGLVILRLRRPGIRGVRASDKD